MGKNGINPSAFGQVKAWLRENVGKEVSITEIFGHDASKRNAYNSYLSMLVRVDCAKLVDGVGFTDPMAVIRILKALPEDWGSADLRDAAKDAAQTKKLNEII